MMDPCDLHPAQPRRIARVPCTRLPARQLGLERSPLPLRHQARPPRMGPRVTLAAAPHRQPTPPRKRHRRVLGVPQAHQLPVLGALSAWGCESRRDRESPSRAHCWRTLRWGCPASIRCRVWATAPSHFVLQPVQLHCAWPTLLVAGGWQRFRCFLLPSPRASDQPGGFLLASPLPLGELSWRHPILRSQCGDRLVATHGRERHLCLARATVLPRRATHGCSFSPSSSPTLVNLCSGPVFGVHYPQPMRGLRAAPIIAHNMAALVYEKDI